MNIKLLTLPKLLLIGVGIALLIGGLWYASSLAPAANPSPSPTLPSPSASSPAQTPTPASTPKPSPTTSTSATATPAVTSFPTPTPSVTVSPTATPSLTSPPVVTPTPPVPTPITPTPTPITPPTPTPVVTPPPTPIPTPTPTPPPTSPTNATFDFNTGTPTPSIGQNTPFNQTVNGVTASFSSPSDPAAFSIQNLQTPYVLSKFSGNYLYQNNVIRTFLDIKFSRSITSITLTFATVDYHDPGVGGTASNIKLTAYVNSAAATPVGSATAFGAFTNDTYPQGTLSFSSVGQPFNILRIELPFLPQGATNFLIDNVKVTTT